MLHFYSPTLYARAPEQRLNGFVRLLEPYSTQKKACRSPVRRAGGLASGRIRRWPHLPYRLAAPSYFSLIRHIGWTAAGTGPTALAAMTKSGGDDGPVDWGAMKRSRWPQCWRHCGNAANAFWCCKTRPCKSGRSKNLSDLQHTRASSRPWQA